MSAFGGATPTHAPLSAARAARDALLDAAELIGGRIAHSEPYAVIQGQALTAALTLTAPGARLARELAVRTARELGLPIRADAIALARRLIAVELRLDDLDARLDGIDAKLEALLDAPRMEAAGDEEPAGAVATRA